MLFARRPIDPDAAGESVVIGRGVTEGGRAAARRAAAQARQGPFPLTDEVAVLDEGRERARPVAPGAEEHVIGDREPAEGTFAKPDGGVVARGPDRVRAQPQAAYRSDHLDDL